jgi:hypothetical protein
MATLSELVSICRTRFGDTIVPYFLTDDEWTLHLSDAEREACIRAKLLRRNTGTGTELTLDPEQLEYPLHPSVLDVISIAPADDPMKRITGWDLSEDGLILLQPVSTPMDVVLTIYRLPVAYIMPESGPEIREQHHINLIDWALRCAYLKQDADTFDKDAAMRHEIAFMRAFGERNDANVQRKHKRKTPRVTRAIPF